MLTSLLWYRMDAINFTRIWITCFAVYTLSGCFRNACRREMYVGVAPEWPDYCRNKFNENIHKAVFHETWYVASGTPANHSLFKWWPWGDLDLFNSKVKFCNLGFSVGKREKVDFSESIAACDLTLIELMTICEYSRSISFLDLGPMSFTYEH